MQCVERVNLRTDLKEALDRLPKTFFISSSLVLRFIDFFPRLNFQRFGRMAHASTVTLTLPQGNISRVL